MSNATVCESVVAKRAAFFNEMGQVKSMDELNDFIKINWAWFELNGKEKSYLTCAQKLTTYELVELRLVAYWDECARNSHSAPKLGVQNFDTRRNLGMPRSYPGWRGTIYYSIHTKKGSGLGSRYFSDTTIHTGSGGACGYDMSTTVSSYSYELTLFGADFPVMYEQREREQFLITENNNRQKAWRMLGGTGTPPKVTEIPNDWKLPDPLVTRSPVHVYL
jgi:hypothetical protein